MTDTISRIFGPQNISSGTTTLFTGTGGHTYSFVEIIVLNNGSTSVTIKMGVGGVADANLFMQSIAIAAGESEVFRGLLPIAGTETIQANASASGLTITASGLDQS